MKKVALVSAALLVSGVLSSSSATAAPSQDLASVFPHEVVHTSEGDFVIYFIEEDILIEAPAGADATAMTAFEEVDGLVDLVEQTSMTCNGVKTTPGDDGTSGSDDMDGESTPDVMHGYGSGDTMDGFGSLDTMCGGGGNDVVRGGPGEDTVIGGSGHDEIRGGTGTDSLEARGGNDDAYDGSGSDDIDLIDGVQGDQLYRCADATEDVWRTDNDEVEVLDVAASSSYC